MFDSTSRYASLTVKTLEVTDPDGTKRKLQYVARRILPAATSGATIVEHTVTQGERLDNLTARYLGDPTHYWRVCDANEVLDPGELTEAVGGHIRIALPGV